VTARIVAAAALVASAFLALAALAPGAATRPPRAAVEGKCGTETVTVLFWPRGHGAIAPLGMPKLPVAHVEVYRYAGARTYRNQNLVAYVDGTGKISLRRECRRVRVHATVRPFRATSLKRAVAITCRTKLNSLIQTRRVAASGVNADIRVIEQPNRVVVRAVLARIRSNSWVSYNPTRCRIGKPPN
jgi:hypothetical protein